jgi:hypothetical protein
MARSPLAQVIPIDRLDLSPNARVRLMSRAQRETVGQLKAALIDQGLIPARPDVSTPIGTLLDRVSWETGRFEQTWRRRTHKAERALRAVLDGDGLTPQNRARVLTALYGGSGPHRDARLLADHEWTLIQNYRRCDQTVRTALRTVADVGAKRPVQKIRKTRDDTP